MVAAALAAGAPLTASRRAAGERSQAGAPDAPGPLSAAVSADAVTLTWSVPVQGAAPVAYQLEAGSSPGASDVLVTQLAALSASASGVPGGIYYVRVRGVNAAGAGPASNEVVVTVGCGAALAAPGGLVSSVAGQVVTLRWNPVALASAYRVEAGSEPGLADLGVVPVAAPGLAGAVPNGVYYVRVRASSPCGLSAPSATAVVEVPTSLAPPGTPPPPGTTPPPGGLPPSGGTNTPGLPIWGVVDPAVLGTCSAAVHDRYAVDGGDGWRYRTWHPQTVAAEGGDTCTFAHEHGDNPARMTNAEIAASPVRFGYIGRRHPMPDEPNGHEEPHEGFKVFIALPGEVNDEYRVNRVFSRSVFHMGTGGPRRFAMPHHSAEIRLIHPEFGLKAFTQLMMDTGGVATVCNPRVAAPTKDVVQLGSPCILSSFYEIWSTTASVRFQGREVYRSFATPAVFDPITVLDPANPGAVVYAWDTRMNASLQYPRADRTTFRGCDRESYAQPGYWYNGRGRTTYYTDAMGNELAQGDPMALAQELSSSNSIGAPATNDGLVQFKRRVSYCGQSRQLGLKN